MKKITACLIFLLFPHFKTLASTQVMLDRPIQRVFEGISEKESFFEGNKNTIVSGATSILFSAIAAAFAAASAPFVAGLALTVAVVSGLWAAAPYLVSGAWSVMKDLGSGALDSLATMAESIDTRLSSLPVVCDLYKAISWPARAIANAYIAGGSSKKTAYVCGYAIYICIIFFASATIFGFYKLWARKRNSKRSLISKVKERELTRSNDRNSIQNVEKRLKKGVWQLVVGAATLATLSLLAWIFKKRDDFGTQIKQKQDDLDFLRADFNAFQAAEATEREAEIQKVRRESQSNFLLFEDQKKKEIQDMADRIEQKRQRLVQLERELEQSKRSNEVDKSRLIKLKDYICIRFALDEARKNGDEDSSRELWELMQKTLERVPKGDLDYFRTEFKKEMERRSKIRERDKTPPPPVYEPNLDLADVYDVSVLNSGYKPNLDVSNMDYIHIASEAKYSPSLDFDDLDSISIVSELDEKMEALEALPDPPVLVRVKSEENPKLFDSMYSKYTFFKKKHPKDPQFKEYCDTLNPKLIEEFEDLKKRSDKQKRRNKVYSKYEVLRDAAEIGGDFERRKLLSFEEKNPKYVNYFKSNYERRKKLEEINKEREKEIAVLKQEFESEIAQKSQNEENRKLIISKQKELKEVEREIRSLILIKSKHKFISRLESDIERCLGDSIPIESKRSAFSDFIHSGEITGTRKMITQAARIISNKGTITPNIRRDFLKKIKRKQNLCINDTDSYLYGNLRYYIHSDDFEATKSSLERIFEFMDFFSEDEIMKEWERLNNIFNFLKKSYELTNDMLDLQND